MPLAFTQEDFLVRDKCSLNFFVRYNPKKGFFCQVVNGDQSKCLGRSKGRLYPQMELKAEKFLSNYYR